MEDPEFPVEIEISGKGPTLLMLPGSFSTAAAWRPVRRFLENRHRIIAASLPGYGGSTDRRNENDAGIATFSPFLARLAREAGGPVHLVAHSFGATVALAGALGDELEIASLTLVEAIPLHILSYEEAAPEGARYLSEINATRDAGLARMAEGRPDSARMVINMWSGAGSFESLAPPVQDYALKTAAVNLRDWESALDFDPGKGALATLACPVALVHGTQSHPSIALMNGLLEEEIATAQRFPVEGASHFLPYTHAEELSRIIAENCRRAESQDRTF
jgi:pimeloyl-ACP methyl ester carboxylesterase